MTMKRRDFLKIAALSYGAVSLPLQAESAWAQTGARSKRPLYLAFPDGTPREVKARIAQLGGRTASPDGTRRYAIYTNLNPVHDNYTREDKAREYPVADEAVLRQLRFFSAMGHPVVIKLFASKHIRSALTDYLVAEYPQSLMRDQRGKLMGPDSSAPEAAGETYFAFAPHIKKSPKYPNGLTNDFLRLYERNTRRCARLIAEECARDPKLRSLIRVVTIAGEMKFPLFRYANGTRRWADYSPFAVHAFRNYVRSRIGPGKKFASFTAYRKQMRIGLGEMPSDGIDGLDPPRGTRRYGWDRLDKTDNLYFMDWARYRVLEIKNHIRTFMRWCQEEGLFPDQPARYYSDQALFLTREEYYWRSATLETLKIPESPNPGVSLYRDSTADGELMASIQRITRKYNHAGGWCAGQYNPKGPKRHSSTDPNKGYPVSEYLDRLHLAENRGCRAFAILGFPPDERGHANPDLTLRENFITACRRFIRTKR